MLKADTFVSPSDATLLHTDSTKAKNYFHKARKVNSFSCVSSYGVCQATKHARKPLLALLDVLHKQTLDILGVTQYQ